MNILGYQHSFTKLSDWAQSLVAAVPPTFLFLVRQYEPTFSSSAFKTYLTWALNILAVGVVPGWLIVISRFTIRVVYVTAYGFQGGQRSLSSEPETVPSLDEVVEWFSDIVSQIGFPLPSDGSNAEISRALANTTTAGNSSNTRITSLSI